MHGDTSKSLLQAIRSGDKETARRILLSRNFTNIDRQTSRKDGTPLFWCCCLGYVDLAHLLLLNGADVNAPTAWGATPLHACVDRNFVDIVALLVRFGANLNKQTNHGDTPCHLASYRGFIHCVKRLADEGADVDIRNSKRLTPVEEAYIQGHYDVYRYLVAIQQIARSSRPAKCSLDSLQYLDTHDATSLQYTHTQDATSLKSKNMARPQANDSTHVHVQKCVHQPSPPLSATEQQHPPATSLPVQIDSCSVRSEIEGNLFSSETDCTSIGPASLCNYNEEKMWENPVAFGDSEVKASNVPVGNNVIGVLRLGRPDRLSDSDSSFSSTSSSLEVSCSSLNDLSATPSTFSQASGRPSVHKLSFKNI